MAPRFQCRWRRTTSFSTTITTPSATAIEVVTSSGPPRRFAARPAGGPVDDQRDDHRNHQPAGWQLLSGGGDDGGGDDRAVDSGRATAATVSILGRLRLTHDLCLRGLLCAPGYGAPCGVGSFPMLASARRTYLHPAGMNSTGGKPAAGAGTAGPAGPRRARRRTPSRGGDVAGDGAAVNPDRGRSKHAGATCSRL
jgi:hypothetical protein